MRERLKPYPIPSVLSCPRPHWSLASCRSPAVHQQAALLRSTRRAPWPATAAARRHRRLRCPRPALVAVSAAAQARDLTAFIARLPKAELHLHVEGSLEPELMMALAARNHVTVPYADVQAARDARASFTSLQDFLNLYYEGMSVLLVRHHNPLCCSRVFREQPSACRAVLQCDRAFSAERVGTFPGAPLQTEQDFFDLTDAYLARAASEGVRHTEIMFDPQAHLNR